jgi:hypothetical protein
MFRCFDIVSHACHSPQKQSVSIGSLTVKCPTTPIPKPCLAKTLIIAGEQLFDSHTSQPDIPESTCERFLSSPPLNQEIEGIRLDAEVEAFGSRMDDHFATSELDGVRDGCSGCPGGHLAGYVSMIALNYRE